MRRSLTTVSVFFLFFCFATLVRAQEPQDRCANNKSYLAFYSKQANTLEFIPDAAQLKKMRDRLSELNKAIAEKTTISDYESDWVRSYLSSALGLPPDAVNASTERFQILVRDRLNIVITQVVDEGFQSRKERADFARQQIKIHQNRLLDLKCGQPEEAAVCKLAGKWRQSVGSTWTVTADGTATEQGLGGATGRASLSGLTMKIEWSHPNGWSGTYQWLMDKTCKTGKGKLIFKSGGSGEQPSNVTYTP